MSGPGSQTGKGCWGSVLPSDAPEAQIPGMGYLSPQGGPDDPAAILPFGGSTVWTPDTVGVAKQGLQAGGYMHKENFSSASIPTLGLGSDLVWRVKSCHDPVRWQGSF